MTDQVQQLLIVELRKRGDPISLEAAAEIERLNGAVEIMGPTAVLGVRNSEPILREHRFSGLAVELRRDAAYSERVGSHVVTAVLTPPAARELADVIDSAVPSQGTDR